MRRRIAAVPVLAGMLVAAGCGGTRASQATASHTTASDPPRRPAATASGASTAAPSRSTSTVQPAPAPAPISALASSSGGGSASWQPAPNSAIPNGYAMYSAQVSPYPGSQPVGLVWINPKATTLSLYAGVGQPAGTWPNQSYVGAPAQQRLLAAFDSGFSIYNYRTGWYEQGVAAEPLQAGMASLVIYSNGSATVADWGRDATLTPDVVAVRQNLPLLVDGGAPAADAGIPSDWGAVLYGREVTWRSGLGVTASGDLVYAGGPGLDPAELASVLIAAGAIRAMELDINPEWVSFSFFDHSAGSISSAANLLPGMYFQPQHYLEPFSRDFVAVFAR